MMKEDIEEILMVSEELYSKIKAREINTLLILDAAGKIIIGVGHVAIGVVLARYYPRTIVALLVTLGFVFFAGNIDKEFADLVCRKSSIAEVV